MTSVESAFERRLATALEGLRPADGAPPTLRGTVVRIAESRHLRWFERKPAAVPSVLAAFTVAAALLLAAVIGPLHATIDVGGGGEAPQAVLFDPRAEGPGLMYGVWPTLLILPGIVAIVAVAGAIRHVLRARWIGGWAGALRLLVLGAIAIAATGLGLHPGFQWGGVIGSVMGYGIQVQPPPGSLDDVEVWYENVPPGDPLVLVVSITNPGPLPIRIEGIVEDPNARDMVISRWVGMTVWTDPSVLPDLGKIPAFAPVTVEPNDQVYAYLAAKAGACSFGPGFTLNTTDPDLGGYSNRGRIINFAYSVFGLEGIAPFELPVTLVEPMRNRCPATSP